MRIDGFGAIGRGSRRGEAGGMVFDAERIRVAGVGGWVSTAGVMLGLDATGTVLSGEVALHLHDHDIRKY